MVLVVARSSLPQAPPGYPLQVRPRSSPTRFGLSAPIPCPLPHSIATQHFLYLYGYGHTYFLFPYFQLSIPHYPNNHTEKHTPHSIAQIGFWIYKTIAFRPLSDINVQSWSNVSFRNPVWMAIERWHGVGNSVIGENCIRSELKS